MTKVPIHGFEYSIDTKGGNSWAFLPAWPDVGQEGKKTGEAQNLSAVTDQIMKSDSLLLQLIFKSTGTKILSNFIYTISSKFNYLHLSYINDWQANTMNT